MRLTSCGLRPGAGITPRHGPEKAPRAGSGRATKAEIYLKPLADRSLSLVISLPQSRSPEDHVRGPLSCLRACAASRLLNSGPCGEAPPPEGPGSAPITRHPVVSRALQTASCAAPRADWAAAKGPVSEAQAASWPIPSGSVAKERHYAASTPRPSVRYLQTSASPLARDMPIADLTGLAGFKGRTPYHLKVSLPGSGVRPAVWRRRKRH